MFGCWENVAKGHERMYLNLGKFSLIEEPSPQPTEANNSIVWEMVFQIYLPLLSFHGFLEKQIEGLSLLRIVIRSLWHLL